MVYSQDMVLSATFGALADPTRRSILSRLAEREQSIGELASQFAMSLPAVSKHLRVLKRAGLAEIRKSGRVRHCRLLGAPLQDASDWIGRYRAFWEAQFDRLAAYLATPSPEDTPTWPIPNPPRSRSRSRGSSTRRGRESSTRGRGRTS